MVKKCLANQRRSGEESTAPCSLAGIEGFDAFRSVRPAGTAELFRKDCMQGSTLSAMDNAPQQKTMNITFTIDGGEIAKPLQTPPSGHGFSNLLTTLRYERMGQSTALLTKANARR